MGGVSIIGIGTTPFGILEGKSLKEMVTIACSEAIKDSGIKKNVIEAFYLGNFISGILLGQETIAPLVANSLGLPKDIPCTKVELSEGIKVTARVKSMDKPPLKVGDPVRFFKKDEIGYWFKMA